MARVSLRVGALLRNMRPRGPYMWARARIWVTQGPAALALLQLKQQLLILEALQWACSPLIARPIGPC